MKVRVEAMRWPATKLPQQQSSIEAAVRASRVENVSIVYIPPKAVVASKSVTWTEDALQLGTKVEPPVPPPCDHFQTSTKDVPASSKCIPVIAVKEMPEKNSCSFSEEVINGQNSR